MDTVVAALILAVSGWLFYVTTTFDPVSALLGQNIPPEFFPQIVLIIIMLLTAALPFEHLLRVNRGRNIDKDRSGSVPLVTWITMAALITIAAVSPYLGTVLTMLAVCLVIPPLWGERRLRYIVPFAILFPAAVTVLFQTVLGVYFEPGILGVTFR